MNSNENNGLVYSTSHGKMCPRCNNPVANCTCSKTHDIPAGDGIVRVWRQTKGRKGKAVTVITGIPLPGPQLKKIAKQLKQKCGAGGTVKAGTIEIQGDHRDLLITELQKKGYTVKKSGG